MYILPNIDRRNHSPLRSLVVAVSIALAPFAIVLAISIARIILAGEGAVAPEMDIASCSRIESDAARLHCYDKLANRAPAQPAKGGYAPILPSRSE
jgi:hypothetical protein